MYLDNQEFDGPLKRLATAHIERSLLDHTAILTLDIPRKMTDVLYVGHLSEHFTLLGLVAPHDEIEEAFIALATNLYNRIDLNVIALRERNKLLLSQRNKPENPVAEINYTIFTATMSLKVTVKDIVN